MGEVMFRGNVVMKGYLKNKAATEKALAGGWFHSGDLGVKHKDGYVQLRDRSKDIIISGGENISSIEVEDALFEHPGVQLAAVVARPDDKWGETPCAFVEMKPGHSATAEELIEWCRARLARYKCPRHIVFAEIPKTSTGKVQKFALRERAKADRGGGQLSVMRSDAWPQHCRAALVRAVSAAAAQFPGPGEEAPKRVHDVRKTLKEARAIARLFLDCVGEPARVTITTLAATRRQIGRARDLDVMAIRVQRLEPPPEVSEPLMAAIAREREAAQRARRGLSATAPRPRLNAIVRRVEGWDLSAVGTEEIVAAVARTYRQARKRGRLAFDGDDPVALHAFRARVVDLRYQLALLSCAWPEALNAQAEALNDLREALGDFNDLHVLGTFAAEHGELPPQALEELGVRMEAKQKKLKRRANVEFERLFAETPNAFATRIAAYLNHPVREPEVAEDEPKAVSAA